MDTQKYKWVFSSTALSIFRKLNAVEKMESFIINLNFRLFFGAYFTEKKVYIFYWKVKKEKKNILLNDKFSHAEKKFLCIAHKTLIIYSVTRFPWNPIKNQLFPSTVTDIQYYYLYENISKYIFKVYSGANILAILICRYRCIFERLKPEHSYIHIYIDSEYIS